MRLRLTLSKWWYDISIGNGGHTKTKPPVVSRNIGIWWKFADISLDKIYSGFVTLIGFLRVMFLAEPNNLQILAKEIGNDYLDPGC